MSQVPAAVGRRRIERLLGRGGQGAVFLAIDEATGQSVAVKFLAASPDAPVSSEQFVAEYRLCAQLAHPHIARLIDADAVELPGGRRIPYYVMEHIRGARPINRYAEAERLPIAERIDLFLRVCDAVQYLHSRGVIHLDLKPSNILVDDQGVPKVTDFGLSRLLLSSNAPEAGGTPGYESPEQAAEEGGPPDHRADVYALGVVLYELLAGRPPIEPPSILDGGSSDPAYRAALATSTPPPLHQVNPQVPRSVSRLVAWALEKSPGRRPATVAEFAAALRRRRTPPAREVSEVGDYFKRRARDVSVRASALFLAAAVAVVLAVAVGRPLTFQWTGLHRWYVTALGPVSAAPVDSLQHVRIVALDDSTDVAGFVEETELEGVTTRRGLSLRRLHGRLCTALVEAAPRAVVFDIRFGHHPAAAPYTADFAAGVRTLRTSGVPVVVAAKKWFPDADGLPDMTPELWRAGADWGCIHVMQPTSAGGMLVIPLAARRADQPIAPSLALAGFAAARQPGDDFEITFEPIDNVVTLSYWRPLPDRPDRRRRLKTTDRIAVNAIEAPTPSLTFGLTADDRVAKYVPSTWSPEALDAATLDYVDVLRMDLAERRDRLNGRVIVIGDARAASGDRVRFFGRDWLGAHVHAMAIESLLTAVGPRFADARASFGILIASASLGVLAALWAGGWRSGSGSARGAVASMRRAVKRWSLAALGVAALCLLAVASHQMAGFHWSPFPPILALLAASELAALAPNGR